MDKPFKPKYGTVSQVLLQLVVATVVQLKRTKSRKTLFSSSGQDKHIMFLLVIATGSRSSTLRYGRLFKIKRNENQSIKFSSERTC